jgi:myosin-15
LNARIYPPTLLEHTANSRQTGIALEASFPNGDCRSVSLDSWTTGEEFAADLLRSKNVKNSFGWTTELIEDDDIFELNGSDYVLDLIAETEVPPSFPSCKSYFLGSADRSKPRKNRSRVHDASRFNTIDDELMSKLAMDREKKPERIYESRKALRSSQEHLLRSQQHLSNSVQSLDRHNVSLSKNSRLNQRYLSNGVKSNNKMNGFKQAGGNKRYLPKHASKLSTGESSLKARSISMQDLGLASSALNERYFFNRNDMQKAISVTSKTGDLDTMTILKPSNDRCFMDQKSQFMASMVRPSSRSSSSLSSEGSGRHNNGHQTSDPSINARYVKYPGKQNGRQSHSHSTKAYIDRNSDRRMSNELDNYSIDPRSSAMSDTSEAPSLASHVRNVKIPSLVSDLDQYLDDLFNPVLDGNLDELSDARSLAASIKGGGKPGLLDSLDIDTSEVNGLCSSSLSREIKGGGVRPGVTPQVNLKKVNATNQSSSNASDSAFTNVAGMTVPVVGTSKVIQQQLVHQQMIQRAFLASAVQQNLQMQQQLLEQNEALQKLLEANPNDEVALASLSSLMQQGIDSGISLSTASGLSPSSSVSMQPDSVSMSSKRPPRGIPAPPPPPPPSPPPVSPTGGNFQDVYGRAKTVRIGKWRWPPAREDNDNQKESNSFLEFKMKKNQDKTSGEEVEQQQQQPQQPQQQQPEQHQPSSTSVVRSSNQTAQEQSVAKSTQVVNTSLNQETSSSNNKSHMKEGEIVLLKNKAKASTTPTSSQPPVVSSLPNNISSNNPSNHLRNNNSGVKGQQNTSSPSQGGLLSRETKTDSSVGKLRISLEMKAKLEQLTTDQTTVRSGKPSSRERLNRSMDDISEAGVKKLSETRKSLLEQQLLGSMRIPGQTAPVKPPIDVIDKLVMARSHENIPHSESDGIVKIEDRFAPHRRSMSREHRERRDELGPRKTHAPASTVNAECGDDVISRSLSDNFFDDSTLHNGSTTSSGKGVKRMGIPPPPPPHHHHRSQEIYSTRPQTSCSSNTRGMTPLVVKKRDAPPLPSNMKSISHDRLDLRSDFGESDFLSTMGGSTANDKGYQSDVLPTQTKVYPPKHSTYLTYNRVNWELRLRKEFFYPGEKIEDPMTLNLIFCQIVRDAYCRHLIRLSREDREQLQAQLRNYGIAKDNVLSGSHKLTTQRSVIDFAMDLPTYFSRLYPISGGRKIPNINLLGISHSGVKFVQRDKDPQTSNDHLRVVEALPSVSFLLRVYHFSCLLMNVCLS